MSIHLVIFVVVSLLLTGVVSVHAFGMDSTQGAIVMLLLGYMAVALTVSPRNPRRVSDQQVTRSIVKGDLMYLLTIPALWMSADIWLLSIVVAALYSSYQNRLMNTTERLIKMVTPAGNFKSIQLSNICTYVVIAGGICKFAMAGGLPQAEVIITMVTMTYAGWSFHLYSTVWLK